MAFAMTQTEHVLLVKFFGAVSIQDRRAAMKRVVNASMVSGATKILADFREASTVCKSVGEARDYAAELAREPTLKNMSIAYLGNAGNTGDIESMAALRGYFFQRFASLQAAKRWLG